MTKQWLLASAVTLFMAVALGAFGAHGLKARLTPDMMAIYQTAVQYQFWHGLGLGLIAIVVQQYGPSPLLIWAGRFMVAGILVFSGSLYLLTITDIRWLGAITPLGGMSLLTAWLLLAVFAWQ